MHALASTAYVDKNGNQVDISASMNEREVLLGNRYVWNSDYTVLAADQHYRIGFLTNSDMTQLLNGSVTKSGDELVISMIEGCTVTSGLDFSFYNANRTFGDSPQPVSSAKKGASLSGGDVFMQALAPGSNAGQDQKGDIGAVVPFIVLNPSTWYGVDILSKGDASFILNVSIQNKE